MYTPSWLLEMPTEKGFKWKFKTEAPTDGLMNLTVYVQYLESYPVQIAVFLRERKPKELNELAILAEQYLDAHDTVLTMYPGDQWIEIGR